jgi:hypothetical protein
MSYGFRRGGKSEGVIGNSRKPVSIMPFFVSELLKGRNINAGY